VAVVARRKRGHVNKWLAALPGIRKRFKQEHDMGYPVFRAWNPEAGIEAVIKHFSPSIIIAIAGFSFKIAAHLDNSSIPVFLYLRDNKRWLDRLPQRLQYLANSQYIADYHETHCGIRAPVVQPLVPPEHYQAPGPRNRVVLVNPKSEKGVEIFFGLARLRPDIDFEIVESWPLRTIERLRLKSRARAFKNIIWRSAVVDMRLVYRTAKIMLVPSQWPEAWCRVVSEAHCNGIPVIASNLGGLPESVGNGGILVDHDADLETWNEALSELWDKAENYRDYSKAALDYSERPEIDAWKLGSQFIKIMSKAVKQ